METTPASSATADAPPPAAAETASADASLLPEDRRDAVRKCAAAGCCAYCTLRFAGCRSIPAYHDIASSRAAIERVCGHALVDGSICVACFGFLPECGNEALALSVVEQVKASGYAFREYSLTITLALSCVVRHYSLVHHINEGRETKLDPVTDVVDIKEVAKWLGGAGIPAHIGVPFRPMASFRVNLNVSHVETDAELAFLSQFKYSQSQRKSKFHSPMQNTSITTATNMISLMTPEQFRKHCSCPPAQVTTKYALVTSFTHDSVFAAGRYFKYDNKLSQTPWIIDNVRRGESSVEELIADVIAPSYEAVGGRKFSASGREDIDVRMLGNGRPFVIEFINPRRAYHSDEEFAEMQAKVNASTQRVQVAHLQSITSEQFNIIKDGEQDKRKDYRALVWASRELTDADLQCIRDIKDLKIAQKTPLRVLHRRTLATRPKVIHNADCELLNTHFFVLRLTTQAGTYIKEFCHGDFGRTQPNIGTMLHADADILQLDVTAVDLAFPPPIRPTPLLPHSFTIPDTVNVEDFNRASDE
eukprot:TRINITY_DN2457_c0_g1_i1.p1 TRINITY_DN2457_c0_g1~~TRINITY_DN2457_c0_g1_i1.p1  ORF type:complete len:543 (-),score=132.07 TRINITY_DN2457_c0_g1_i1:131-1729(-)